MANTLRLLRARFYECRDKLLLINPDLPIDLRLELSSIGHELGDVIRELKLQEKAMSMEINHEQAKKLLEMFGGEDASITVTKNGDDLVAYHTDYPEEGSLVLE